MIHAHNQQFIYVQRLFVGGEERLGGDERGDHRRPETHVHGVSGRRQEEEERSPQRSFLPNGPISLRFLQNGPINFGGKLKNLAPNLNLFEISRNFRLEFVIFLNEIIDRRRAPPPSLSPPSA